VTRSGQSGGALVLVLVPVVLALAACGKVEGVEGEPDGGVDASVEATLGSEARPAAGCRQLRDAGAPSGAYWVRPLEPGLPSIQVYCEQAVAGGGWALLYNSVHRIDGTTLAFWNIPYEERFRIKGAPGLADNYYAGGNYVLGTSYLDVIVDGAGTAAVAAVVDSAGIDIRTMVIGTPVLVEGNDDVFRSQFAAGWSSPDFDGDTREAGAGSLNCAVYYGNVTQHYSKCWTYNLGADAEEPYEDGGVGPHVANSVLVALGLVVQPDGADYSRVQRISRFVRY
jgi:hypothetical protein